MEFEDDLGNVRRKKEVDEKRVKLVNFSRLLAPIQGESVFLQWLYLIETSANNNENNSTKLIKGLILPLSPLPQVPVPVQDP